MIYLFRLNTVVGEGMVPATRNWLNKSKRYFFQIIDNSKIDVIFSSEAIL